MAIINGKVFPLTALESKEIKRIENAKSVSTAYAQTSADVWMRSAATIPAASRRKNAVSALGLVGEIQYL